MPAAIGLMLLQTVPSALPLPRITPLPECPRTQDEIVVRGRRDAAERYRIPPFARGPSGMAGEAGAGLSGANILGGTGPCGIHAGQRRCTPGEAGQAGYGGGRDPLTVGRKVLTRLIDPSSSQPTGRR